MPRLNIETKVAADQRFQDLLIAVGDRPKAKGHLWELWELAQEHWWPNKRPIPKEAWTAARMPQALVDCGFAEERDGGYYAKGSEEQFAWLFERRESGRRGGLASAEARKSADKKPKRAKEKNKQAELELASPELKLAQAELKQNEPSLLPFSFLPSPYS